MKNFKIFLLVFVFMFFSAMVFAQTITVNDPHVCQTWCRGNPYTINWTKSGVMHGKVKIRLYNSAGTVKILNITDDTNNDGSYDWTIPVSVAPGSYCVRVKTLDNAVYDDSVVFSIADCPSATIIVTDPHTGDKWERGKTYGIHWTKTGAQHTKVKIRLYNTAGTVKILDITNDTNNDGSFGWTIPASVAPGSYLVRVKTIDGAVYDDSNVFTVSVVKPIPFEVYKPQFNYYHWIGFKMAIKWKNKLMGKFAKINQSSKYRVDVERKVELLKRVKIEIKSVKCPIISKRRRGFLRKVYSDRKYKLKESQINALLDKPWVQEIAQWKTIVAGTNDDGSHIWKVPGYFKKGCYKIRVTKLWGNQGSAESKVFHLIPIVINPRVPLGLFNVGIIMF